MKKKGYLFYIYKVNFGYNYKTVDPKYYSEEELKKFASEYAKDGILYKTEKECQDIIKEVEVIQYELSMLSLKRRQGQK